MKRELVGLGAIAALLSGCPTQELVVNQPEAPWETRGIQTVEVPAFEAQPAAWTVGEEARQQLMGALNRGTVRVVDRNPQGILEGAVTVYDETTSTSAPRRVQQSSSAGGLSGVSYMWQLDATYTVRMGLVMRLKDAKGSQVFWTKETFGDGTETSTVNLNWPGSDPVPPPSVLPSSPDRSVFLRLRQEALNEAMEPLIGALTVHYGYKPLR